MTGHVNDLKLSALQSLLSISGGNIDDLEQAWLISEASAFGHVNDMWMNVFLANGATSLNYSDASYEFLAANGFANGGVTQRWHDYWLNGGGIGGFSPPDIAGLELWYNQSDISTLWQDSGRTTAVTAPGDPVGAWDDKSGNGGHALQSIGGDKPTYQTSGIFFNDINNWLDNFTHIPPYYPLTMFAVFRVGSGKEGHTIGISSTTATTRYTRHLIRNSGYAAYQASNNVPISDIFDTATNAYNDDANHIQTTVGTDATNRELWVDGGDYQSSSVNVAAQPVDTVCIGRLSRATPSSYYGGYMLEAAFYNTALSIANRQAFENYAITKWGI